MTNNKIRRSKRKALPLNDCPKITCKVKKVTIRLNSKYIKEGSVKKKSVQPKLNKNDVPEVEDGGVKVSKIRKYNKKNTKDSVQTIDNGISELAEQFILGSITVTKNYNKKQNSHIKRMTDFARDYKNGENFGHINFNDLFDKPATKNKKKMFNNLMCRFVYLLKKL